MKGIPPFYRAVTLFCRYFCGYRSIFPCHFHNNREIFLRTVQGNGADHVRGTKNDHFQPRTNCYVPDILPEKRVCLSRNCQQSRACPTRRPHRSGRVWSFLFTDLCIKKGALILIGIPVAEVSDLSWSSSHTG